MTEVHPCLVRIGERVKKYKVLIFDKDEVTVGRSPDATFCILSTMISRCHAIFKKTAENTWTVTDNKSLNGVFVNKVKIDAAKSFPLEDGDIVQFAVTNAEDKQEFRYRFSISTRVKRSRRESDDSGKPIKKSRQDEVDSLKLTQKSPDCDNRVSSSQPDVGADENSCVSSPYKLYKEKLQEFQKQEEEKRQEYQTKLNLMQKMLEEKELEQSKMKEALEKEKIEKLQTEAKLKSALELKQEEMEKEKEELKQKMQDELETQLKTKEASLLEQLKIQQETLVTEKARVEESLKQEMELAKNKQLELALTEQRDKLQKVIDSKELEQRVLESQLQETKAENVKTKEAMLCAREDVLTNFKDLMETELQCSICSELFIQATSLNCSHGFCALCIEQWMKVKKECPICRTRITSHMRSIVLDSYIDKMVEQLDDHMRKERKELVDGRKEEYKKMEEKKKLDAPGSSGNTRGGRGRRGVARTRGSPSRGRAPITVVSTSPNTRSRAAIIISDEDDDEDDEDDDDDIYRRRRHYDDDDDEDDVDGMSTDSELDDSDDIEGDPGAYYGGYGRCYNCGRSGHWANGCPDA